MLPAMGKMVARKSMRGNEHYPVTTKHLCASTPEAPGPALPLTNYRAGRRRRSHFASGTRQHSHPKAAKPLDKPQLAT